jgi:hypothetical protein
MCMHRHLRNALTLYSLSKQKTPGTQSTSRESHRKTKVSPDLPVTMACFDVLYPKPQILPVPDVLIPSYFKVIILGAVIVSN